MYGVYPVWLCTGHVTTVDMCGARATATGSRRITPKDRILKIPRIRGTRVHRSDSGSRPRRRIALGRLRGNRLALPTCVLGATRAAAADSVEDAPTPHVPICPACRQEGREHKTALEPGRHFICANCGARWLRQTLGLSLDAAFASQRTHLVDGGLWACRASAATTRPRPVVASSKKGSLLFMQHSRSDSNLDPPHVRSAARRGLAHSRRSSPTEPTGAAKRVARCGIWQTSGSRRRTTVMVAKANAALTEPKNAVQRIWF